MLLTAEDQAKFRALIEHQGAKVCATYWVEGQLAGQPITQSDKRLFASTQEARVWLIGEADRRGFKDCEPEDRTAFTRV